MVSYSGVLPVDETVSEAVGVMLEVYTDLGGFPSFPCDFQAPSCWA